ncbi:MAG: hypothetical protein WA709_32225 [Stellaceae bacterium]
MVAEEAQWTRSGHGKAHPTLNWVRLAQRIPVRIILYAPPPDAPFRMEMTAVRHNHRLPPNGRPLSVQGAPVASAQ